MTKLQLAEQFRKAVQKFVANLDDEEALEGRSIPDLPDWKNL